MGAGLGCACEASAPRRRHPNREAHFWAGSAATNPTSEAHARPSSASDNFTRQSEQRPLESHHFQRTRSETRRRTSKVLTTVTSRGIQRAKSGTPCYAVNRTVPMKDAVIGRACSTQADPRRRALLVSLSTRARGFTLRPPPGRPALGTTAAASPSHPPMPPGIRSESPPSTFASIRGEPQRMLGRRLNEPGGDGGDGFDQFLRRPSVVRYADRPGLRADGSGRCRGARGVNREGR